MNTVATIQEIRYVPNTRKQYRYLNEAELVAGATAWMIVTDQLPDNLSDLQFFGKTEVTLDPDPLGTREDGTPYVYYHCTKPDWEGQCFVPVAKFISGHNQKSQSRTEYWVPTH